MSIEELRTIVAEPWADWGLIDSGEGRKWERYGAFTVGRPEPQARWSTARSHAPPAATFVPGSHEQGSGRCVHHNDVPPDWQLSRDNVRSHASLTPFRHLAFFPDMAPQWDWMQNQALDADV